VASDVPPDVNPPDLGQPWGNWGPSITGNPRGVKDGNPTTVSSPPSHPAYLVAPGSIAYAGTQILISTQQNINTYNDLKSTVADTKGWIFWAPNSDPHTNGGVQTMGHGMYTPPQPIKDPHPEVTAQISSIEDNLLLEIADAITLAGQFVDVLNNSAQFYTQADKSSVLPEMVTNFHPQTNDTPAIPT
jgi:hypothetical protein